MTAQQMWEEYLSENKIADCGYEAWEFGASPDELAALVKSGIKTATSSAYDLYAKDNEPLPRVGEYSVILSSSGEAVCIIKTIKVEVLKYCDVTEDFAFKEGEGDRTLAYWRRVHEDFFTQELRAEGLEFSPEMKVVCEQFELVFPK